MNSLNSTSSPDHRWRVAASVVLVSVPVIAALATPLYQRTEPTLGGIPFFFWFQISCAVLAAVGCGTTYLLLFRHEDEDD